MIAASGLLSGGYEALRFSVNVILKRKEEECGEDNCADCVEAEVAEHFFRMCGLIPELRKVDEFAESRDVDWADMEGGIIL